MKKQTFQHAEIRDENDNIISSGAYGKNTALSNKQNDGWIDYVMNNLECLYEQKSSVDTSNFVTHAELTGATSGLATKKELGAKANAADVYAKTEADGRYLQKTDKIDAYTKAESDAKYQLKGTYASVEYVDGRVANIVKSAPETLDTLQELAQALGNDPNFATTVAKEIGTKADKATTENALKGKANAADVYTKTESNERYQLKGGASAESFYQWLKERNYDMDNFRGLETVFPIITLPPITVDEASDGDTVLMGSAPPNITLMYGGKTTVSDNGGRWEITSLGELKSGVITIDWIDYAGRKKSTNVNLVVASYCVPKGTEIITADLVKQYNLNRAETLLFPPSVKSVDAGAFRGCTNVTEINIPNCVTLGGSAFNSCSSLTSLSLPACTSVGNSTFNRCSALTSLSLPACTSVGDSAFNGCSALTSLSLPACTNIESYAFNGCNKLRTVILSDKWAPSAGAQIPKTATVYDANKTKKVNWNTMRWVNV